MRFKLSGKRLRSLTRKTSAELAVSATNQDDAGGTIARDRVTILRAKSK